MLEPTQEQIKKFWEYWGFRQLPVDRAGFHYERGIRVGNWMPPDAHTESSFYSKHYLPEINLDNLFRWVVPKLTYAEVATGLTTGTFRSQVKITYERGSRANAETPALALFWAIWQVMSE